FLFFFQAEDGIRDLTVTGVQTCALPICWPSGADRLTMTSAMAGFRLHRPTGNFQTYLDALAGVGHAAIPRSSAGTVPASGAGSRSEEHTSELQSQSNLVCRLLLEKKKNK